MRNAAWRRFSLGALALLLEMCILLIMLFAPQGKLYAQVARPLTPARAAQEVYAGKVIVVSLSQQWLYAYEDGNQVFDTAVMTGRPSLPTPTGTYRIYAKRSPTTFTSPFPRGSVNWYPPTHINYALEWKPGFFLHDSYWHTAYGPGTNGWHKDPTYGWQWGSHGCVSMALDSAAWLYKWAPIGTIVRIVA